eukprot:CAMPEP_0195085914 /NCGR_PEP_ID=MMETSP0448-20130528/26202_1 /TAXON_ID=66468 /ORGANISM="Heterocapsa triquestra, Strain CCMP 448" /LENGTH=52 /DNA_ID=CAMNT_0040119335 /DNA_START=47 /DNA_END=202 /DNA_ORIENTATION=+
MCSLCSVRGEKDTPPESSAAADKLGATLADCLQGSDDDETFPPSPGLLPLSW